MQPAEVSAVGFSGRYDDLLNKPALGGASGLNVGATTGTVAAGDDARIVNAAQKSITVSAGAGLSGGGALAANISLALSSTSLASLALADTAVQPVRKITAGAGLTGGGDFSADRTVALNAASIASLAKADTAVQPAAIANFATRAELTAGLATKLDAGAQAADSAKLQGYTALTLPISTATQTALDGKATTAQGAKADTALQPSDLGALAIKSKVATTDIDATGSTVGGALLTRGGLWVDPSGGGDMFRATYDPTNKAADAFSMGNMAETTTAKVMTDAERTKLAGVAAGATANTGTVTSIGVAVPTGLPATGSITTSGTITLSYASDYQGYTTAEANKLAGIPADADKTPALAAVATTGSYGDLSNKPATFPPSAHTHSPSEVGVGNVANKSEAQMVATGAIADALGGKQPSLGFTPVQQGGFENTDTRKVSIGWGANGPSLRLLVGSTVFGDQWPIDITGTASNASKIGNKTVLETVAGTSAATPGAYSILRWGGSTAANPSVQTPGSNLSHTDGTGADYSSPPQGSWRLMSIATVGSNQGRLSLWLRYA